MAATNCPTCGKHLKVRDELLGKKLKCPGCRTSFFSEGGTARAVQNEQELGQLDAEEPTHAVSVSSLVDWLERIHASWTAFEVNYLRFEWPFGAPRLLCCVQCNGKQFTDVGRCVSCSGTTVGTDLVAAFEPTNRLRLTGAAAYYRAKKTRIC